MHGCAAGIGEVVAEGDGIVAAFGVDVDLRELSRRAADGELLERARIVGNAAYSHLCAAGNAVEGDRFGRVRADNLQNVVGVDTGGCQKAANFQLLKVKNRAITIDFAQHQVLPSKLRIGL